MKALQLLKPIFVNFFILLAGILVVNLFNRASSVFQLAFFGDLLLEADELNQSATVFYMLSIFIAGCIGSLAVTLLKKGKRFWVLLGVFGALALISNGISVSTTLEFFPLVYKVFLFAAVPLQILIGGKLGEFLWSLKS